MIRQLTILTADAALPQAFPQQSTPYRILAVQGTLTIDPGNAGSMAIMEVVYGGVIGVFIAPSAGTTQIGNVGTYCWADPGGTTAILDGTSAVFATANAPKFIITPQMEVRLFALDGATNDVWTNMSLLLDDDPFRPG